MFSLRIVSQTHLTRIPQPFTSTTDDTLITVKRVVTHTHIHHPQCFHTHIHNKQHPHGHTLIHTQKEKEGKRREVKYFEVVKNPNEHKRR